MEEEEEFYKIEDKLYEKCLIDIVNGEFLIVPKEFYNQKRETAKKIGNDLDAFLVLSTLFTHRLENEGIEGLTR